MEARMRLQNALALLHRGRQRPRGGDGVRIAEVLEEEMPVVHVRVGEGLEAARGDDRGHGGGNLIVEGDLVAAPVPPTIDAVGTSRLEDEGARRGGRGGLVRQAQADDARKLGRACALHHDAADTAIAKRAGAAERIGEVLGAGRSGQGLRGHGRPRG
jgi:hypothetical protein